MTTQNAVAHHVRKMGAHFLIEHVDELETSYSFSVDETKQLGHIFGDFRIDDKVKLSVWHRRCGVVNTPQFAKKVAKKFQDKNAQAFFKSEYSHLIGNLYRLLAHAYWVNPLLATFAADGKIRNLEIAASLGLKVPPTVLSNIPIEIVKFAETYAPALLVKPLESFEIREKNSLAHCVARKIGILDVIANVKAISLAPVFLQKYIEKDLEIRAVVIGQQVYSTAIFSQENDRAKEDWRCAPLSDLRYAKFTLPVTIEQALIAFNVTLGLRFSSFDLILTPDGEFYFLECNPDGEWYWLELATGAPIANTLAEDLIINARSNENYNMMNEN